MTKKTEPSLPNIAHAILCEQHAPMTLLALLSKIQRQGHLCRVRYAGLTLRNALLCDDRFVKTQRGGITYYALGPKGATR